MGIYGPGELKFAVYAFLGAKNARIGGSSLYKNKMNIFLETAETKRPTNPGKWNISGKRPMFTGNQGRL